MCDGQGKSKITRKVRTILFQMLDADDILRNAIKQKKLLDQNDSALPKGKLEKYLSGELDHLDKETIRTIMPIVYELLPKEFSITASDGDLHFSFEDNFYKNENERELDRIYRLKREHPFV